MSIFGFGPTPEQMQAMHDRAQLRTEIYQRNLNRFLAELSQEQLVTLFSVISQITLDENPMSPAQYLHGLVAATIQTRFNVCPSCGENHDDDVIENVSMKTLVHGDPTEHQPQQPEQQSVSRAEAEVLIPPNDVVIDFAAIVRGEIEFNTNYADIVIQHIKSDPDTLRHAEDGDLTPAQLAMMKVYNLDDRRYEAEPHQLIDFMCVNCQLVYISVEDRMLKEPDDCHGCHHKSAWGG